jgi:hypothetical protein
MFCVLMQGTRLSILVLAAFQKAALFVIAPTPPDATSDVLIVSKRNVSLAFLTGQSAAPGLELLPV